MEESTDAGSFFMSILYYSRNTVDIIVYYSYNTVEGDSKKNK